MRPRALLNAYLPQTRCLSLHSSCQIPHKLTSKYDESLAAIQERQQVGMTVYKVEDTEFGRRVAAVEKELEYPERG